MWRGRRMALDPRPRQRRARRQPAREPADRVPELQRDARHALRPAQDRASTTTARVRACARGRSVPRTGGQRYCSPACAGRAGAPTRRSAARAPRRSRPPYEQLVARDRRARLRRRRAAVRRERQRGPQVAPRVRGRARRRRAARRGAPGAASLRRGGDAEAPLDPGLASNLSPVTAPTVVILAAGQGTRMRSRTPKMLHEICGRPMIDWTVAAALEAGAAKVVVVGSPDRRARRAAARRRRARGAARAERDRRRGARGRAASSTGDGAGARRQRRRAARDAATRCARSSTRTARTGAAATIVTMVLDDPSGYGRVVRDADGGGRARGRDEAAGRRDRRSELAIAEVNAGVYAFERRGPARRARPRRAPTTPRASCTCPSRSRSSARRRRARRGADASTTRRCCSASTTASSSRACARIAQQRIHEAHMRAGVTIVDPATTMIDVDVRIGADTIIEPSTFLRGATTIGERCTVGPLTTAIDATLGDEVSVVHSYLQELRGAGRRDRRAVRLPAPRRAAARAVEGRHVRRDQELRHRRGHEGPAPQLRRRRRRRAGHEPRRGDDHRQLRRAQQAPHDDRRERADVGRHDARRARHGRRRGLHRRRIGRHRRRPAGRAGDRPRAPDEHRRLRRARRRRPQDAQPS